MKQQIALLHVLIDMNRYFHNHSRQIRPDGDN
jgi:hypothetical protein